MDEIKDEGEGSVSGNNCHWDSSSRHLLSAAFQLEAIDMSKALSKPR
jgi:hypothetical protein